MGDAKLDAATATRLSGGQAASPGATSGQVPLTLARAEAARLIREAAAGEMDQRVVRRLHEVATRLTETLSETEARVAMAEAPEKWPRVPVVPPFGAAKKG